MPPLSGSLSVLPQPGDARPLAPTTLILPSSVAQDMSCGNFPFTYCVLEDRAESHYSCTPVPGTGTGSKWVSRKFGNGVQPSLCPQGACHREGSLMSVFLTRLNI